MQPTAESGQPLSRSRIVISRFLIGITVIALLLITWKTAAALQLDLNEGPDAAQGSSTSSPEIRLSAASGTTTTFKATNNREASNLPSEVKTIPHLVLFRNGELTAPTERELKITVTNLAVPSAGATVSLKLETQDGDPDLGGSDHNRIVVWQASQQVENSSGNAQAVKELTFDVVFDETIGSHQELIRTPTGYYRFELIVHAENQPSSRSLFSTNQEYAFLLESQWVAPLSETSRPRELVVYFCDMTLFQGHSGGTSSQLSRADVPGYIQTELVPQMLAAIQLQTEDWGFSWNGWQSFSGREAEARLEVSLSDGETWYHGPVPDVGYASISINVNAADATAYETLTDAIMSTFHHELFHNLQRALAFSSSGSGDINGKDAAWQFFSEGTASFVVSVAQPQIQFSQSQQPRTYLAKAVKFVGGKGFPGALNTSYTDLNPYDAAIFWRFLYEQCSGLSNGLENVGAGMGIIRRTLQVLYTQEIVDIRVSNDLVGFLPALMDRVLSSPEAAVCPFHTYIDSRVRFTQAIYALQLEGGRYLASNEPSECGFYDPHDLYSVPNIQRLDYSGDALVFAAQDQPYPAGIKSSFGVDFVDLRLRSGADGQPLTIQFHPDPQGSAEFHVEIVKIQKQGHGGFSSQKLVQVAPPEILTQQTPAGALSLTIPVVELETYTQLGILITRLDAHEHLDSVGAYTLVLSPTR